MLVGFKEALDAKMAAAATSIALRPRLIHRQVPSHHRGHRGPASPLDESSAGEITAIAAAGRAVGFERLV